jgi:hypothetical protein
MKLFDLLGRYPTWVKRQWQRAGKRTRVIIFILAPQITASTYTGVSLLEMWRNRHNEQAAFREHLLRNIFVWGLAVTWFCSFWLIIVPAVIYFVARG